MSIRQHRQTPDEARVPVRGEGGEVREAGEVDTIVLTATRHSAVAQRSNGAHGTGVHTTGSARFEGKTRSMRELPCGQLARSLAGDEPS